VPPLAPAKVLRTDAAVPTRRRSSRASRVAAITATAVSDGSRGAAKLLEPRSAATTTEPLPVAAEPSQAAAVVEPQHPAAEVEPQPAASTTVATTVVVVTAPPTSPVPAVAGSPGATVVEIPDDYDVPPTGWDQWALVVRGDAGAMLWRLADGAGPSSSRAGPAARLEQGREMLTPRRPTSSMLRRSKGSGRSSATTGPHSTGR
jgi:hypothetical protein